MRSGVNAKRSVGACAMGVANSTRQSLPRAPGAIANGSLERIASPSRRRNATKSARRLQTFACASVGKLFSVVRAMELSSASFSSARLTTSGAGR